MLLAFPNSKPEFTAETMTKGHNAYHEKHAREMGLNFRQWKEAASALLNDEARESYLDWYNEKENKYYRYEKKTARLAVGTQNGSISTFFILQKALRKYYLPNEYLELAEGK